MTDYNALKVPDLKKLLSERSLPLSGNKADLIARLQEDDKKPEKTAASAEDEIDWDEDETKATTASAAAAIAVGGQGPVANPLAVPNQKATIDPSATTDLKVEGGKDAPTATHSAVASSAPTTTEPAPGPAAEPAAPKVDFSIGIQQTDAEKEAERRAARAKRFGITADDEEKKKAERAKKFGLDDPPLSVKGLDEALPERRKRGRDASERQGGRGPKRQTPDRRTEGPSKNSAKPQARPPIPAKKPLGKITDDPSEKAKAEARAKRFASAS